mgnify:CR=1 FL=1
MKTISYPLLLLVQIALISTLQAQLVLQVTALPENTPAPVTLYVAGTFNNWDPGNADFKLTEASSKGTWSLSLNLPAGEYRFKCTRGNWSTVETAAGGVFLPDRILQFKGGKQIETLRIQGWEDKKRNSVPRSTAAANVLVLDEAFYMPELQRSRRIWLYLPKDYHQTNQRYPVLYLQDGQNLFDAATSFSGEWQVDETLNTLGKSCIVVGIDNGGAQRMAEYNPWTHPQYGGGEGAAYARFLVQTLKPFIDRQYRTRPEAVHTAVGGSSMGGLISLYTALEYPQTFGAALVFSPSLWIAPEVFGAAAGPGDPNQRILLLGSRAESAGMAPDMTALHRSLKSGGIQDAALVVHPDGQHSEWYWARVFGNSIRWWLDGQWPGSAALQPTPFQWSRDAAGDLTVKGEGLNGELKLEIRAWNGATILPKAILPGSTWDTGFWRAGEYKCCLLQGEQVLECRQVEVK